MSVYIGDAAEEIILTTEKYDQAVPINLGAGFETTFKELAERIAEITCFKGTLIWEPSKPGGRPRRMLSVARAEKEIGFRTQTNLGVGLKKKVQWYLGSGS